MRPRQIAGVALVAALALPGTALAHVTIRPGESRPAELQRYTVLVPNEGDTATTSLVMRVPKGIDTVLLERISGWRTTALRKGDRVDQLRWSGGRIEPGEYAELHFIARNPVTQSATAWPVLQIYERGKIVRWIGPQDSDEPAPRVKITESANPVDIVSIHGESLPRVTPAAPTPRAPTVIAGTSVRGDNRDQGIAVLALVVGTLALLTGIAALVSGRSSRVARRDSPLSRP